MGCTYINAFYEAFAYCEAPPSVRSQKMSLKKQTLIITRGKLRGPWGNWKFHSKSPPCRRLISRGWQDDLHSDGRALTHMASDYCLLNGGLVLFYGVWQLYKCSIGDVKHMAKYENKNTMIVYWSLWGNSRFAYHIQLSMRPTEESKLGGWQWRAATCSTSGAEG